MFKSGFISIVGRPNVGKSTLMNYIMGEKLSIVSNKPQTTRNNIQTILTTDDYQMVFVDTPGIHKPKHKLGEYMVNSAKDSTKDVDLILFLTNPGEEIGRGDKFILETLRGKNVPVFLVLNKIDEYNKSIGVLEKSPRYSNNITVESVKNNAVVGDVVLMDNPGSVGWGLINHAGIYDGTAGKDWRWVLSSRPGIGVDWETIETIAGYDEVIFYNVFRTSYNEAYYSTQRAINDAIGKPYPEGLSWAQSIKGSIANFYCSKVPWHGYSKITGVDIDYDRGPSVTPEDIYHSPETIRRITYR